MQHLTLTLISADVAVELDIFEAQPWRAQRHRQSGSLWLTLVAVGRVKAGLFGSIYRSGCDPPLLVDDYRGLYFTQYIDMYKGFFL